MLTVGSLFSGIGGFDLGLERTGHMRTVWFCEQDPFCQRVLAKHWPGVPCHPDVRALVADASGDGLADDGRRGTPTRDGQRRPQPEYAKGRQPESCDGALANEGLVPVPVPYVDVLCGGFPCQDISLAGRGAGIGGSRSGLWSEFARLIGELRPCYVIVENVPALLGRGVGRVLGDLAACGYDAEWDCLPASAFGAPHRRDRFWLVAYPQGGGGGTLGAIRAAEAGADAWAAGASEGSRDVADSSRDGAGQPAPAGTVGERAGQGGQPGGTGTVADADESGEHRGGPRNGRWNESPHGGDGRRVWPDDPPGGWWLSEPDVGRVAHGVPARVDRLRSLGNSLVPQIAEYIGMRILEYEEARAAA